MMSNLDERAAQLCKQIGKPEDGKTFAALHRALREQDRDTRHAVAEAINSIERGYIEPHGYASIDPDKAHNAAMNCRGGIK